MATYKYLASGKTKHIMKDEKEAICSVTTSFYNCIAWCDDPEELAKRPVCKRCKDGNFGKNKK